MVGAAGSTPEHAIDIASPLMTDVTTSLCVSGATIVVPHVALVSPLLTDCKWSVWLARAFTAKRAPATVIDDALPSVMVWFWAPQLATLAASGWLDRS